MQFQVTEATDAVLISGAKRVADLLRHELGFQRRSVFEESAIKGGLLVAREANGKVLGFARYHHRRDNRTTLYEIGVDPAYTGQKIGAALIEALKTSARKIGSREVSLKCPVDLQANLFYERLGFVRDAMRSIAGRSRRLFVWRLPLEGIRKITFVASLTAATNDLAHMVSMWEKEGPMRRPFERCIITPLFIDPGALGWVRYMNDQWGVKVTFDSGGFFVQQQKIRYDELFSKLLDFYEHNDWGDFFVLPDFPPISGLSAHEIEERVYVTISEGLRFFYRLPVHIRGRTMGVIQGHQSEQLKNCFKAFEEQGIKHLGFGSFDTSGKNSEINLITAQVRVRLQFVRNLIESVQSRPSLHLFGVSSPRILPEFPSIFATSYDSSGWLRTAGYGNVYLPFMSRKNVSHGGSGISLGAGQTAQEFYTQAEKTGHKCPFCSDFQRLQKDRFVRMWHNALVFSEMTEHLNSDSKLEHSVVS